MIQNAISGREKISPGIEYAKIANLKII